MSYSIGLSDNTYSDVLGLYSREPNDDNIDMYVNVCNRLCEHPPCSHANFDPFLGFQNLTVPCNVV